MTKSGIPKRLWNRCLELEVLIRFYTALGIYKLNGELNETVMTGETADISTIASNGWYDWIKFYDPVRNSFPEDTYYIGRYLGPAIHIGPALMTNILNMNGEVVHRSTYCSLTAKDLNDEEDLRRKFDKKVEENLGPKAATKYLDDMNMEETPTFEIYSHNDGVKGTPDEPPEELEPTPDLSTDVYLNASTVLPLGYKMARGKVFLGNKTLMANQLDARTRTQSSICVGMKWSLTMVK